IVEDSGRVGTDAHTDAVSDPRQGGLPGQSIQLSQAGADPLLAEPAGGEAVKAHGDSRSGAIVSPPPDPHSGTKKADLPVGPFVRGWTAETSLGFLGRALLLAFALGRGLLLVATLGLGLGRLRRLGLIGLAGG